MLHATCMENVPNPCMLHETCMLHACRYMLVTCAMVNACHHLNYACNMHVTCTRFRIGYHQLKLTVPSMQLSLVEIIQGAVHCYDQMPSSGDKQP
jgi:hypothetical protein